MNEDGHTNNEENIDLSKSEKADLTLQRYSEDTKMSRSLESGENRSDSDSTDSYSHSYKKSKSRSDSKHSFLEKYKSLPQNLNIGDD